MQEIASHSDYFETAALPLASLYFGGGTPSLLHPDDLRRIIDRIQSTFGLQASAEITLEANPDDISPERLRAWKAAGVNRLSIGIQSFLDRELLWMRRAHNAAEAKRCVPMALDAGFEALTIDLIYATPTLSTAEWAQTLDDAFALNTTHISAYALTIEPQTLLHHQVNQGEVQPPPDARFVAHFNALTEHAREAGFAHYEISNLARSGHRAIHNSSYWHGQPYLGLGPSAHSYDGRATRHYNVRNVNVYNRQLLKAGQLPIAETEHLSPTDRFNELLMLRLRLLEGIPAPLLDSHLNALPTGAADFESAKTRLLARGELLLADGHLRLSLAARLIADSVTAELMV